jgi:hypothetical protein
MDQESRTASIASEHSPDVAPSLPLPFSPPVLVSASSSPPKEHTNPGKLNPSEIPARIRAQDFVRRGSYSGRLLRNTSGDVFPRHVKRQSAPYNLSASMKKNLVKKMSLLKRVRCANARSGEKKLRSTIRKVPSSS